MGLRWDKLDGTWSRPTVLLTSEVVSSTIKAAWSGSITETIYHLL